MQRTWPIGAQGTLVRFRAISLMPIKSIDRVAAMRRDHHLITRDLRDDARGRDVITSLITFDHRDLAQRQRRHRILPVNQRERLAPLLAKPLSLWRPRQRAQRSNHREVHRHIIRASDAGLVDEFGVCDTYSDRERRLANRTDQLEPSRFAELFTVVETRERLREWQRASKPSGEDHRRGDDVEVEADRVRCGTCGKA